MGLELKRIGLNDHRVDPRDHRAVIRANLALGTGMEEVQRISACMIGAADVTSLAHEAVRGMEMDLLKQGYPVGQPLGPLPEVRKRLGLGHPASREAVAILGARGLLDSRRGPGGGLFVTAPALEDVAGIILMYLALARRSAACVEEFQLLVWQMIIKTSIERDVAPPPWPPRSGGREFIACLAQTVGSATMVLLARLAEMLVHISRGEDAQICDRALESAMAAGDLAKASDRLEDLIGLVSQDAPIVSMEIAERCFSLSGRNSAMALAARMARELCRLPNTQEAVWETAERLGYSDGVVRQARRILQDFGLVRCRQGQKGATLAPPPGPTGVIRLLALCLASNAASTLDKLEAVSFLVARAPVLGARRVRAGEDVGIAQDAPPFTLDALEALELENLVVESSGNSLLVIVVKSLGFANMFAESDPLVPSDLGDMIAINRRILQAIGAGDVEEAEMLAAIKLGIVQQFSDDVERRLGAHPRTLTPTRS